ncbi:hypothetical protein D4764_0165620 [Takifugu flavidus]|uniref:Uncharacterized protein n=1 Tax=Takifugu flavidus TaxID=433684 RepID=A0A5C6MF23_9TELE|nr:hypothetical protein D4764_0165620 [Takifugu flavidus]
MAALSWVHRDLKVEVRAPYKAAPGPMDVFSNPIDASLT